MIANYALWPGSVLKVEGAAVSDANKSPCAPALNETACRIVAQTAWRMEFIQQSGLELAAGDRKAPVSPGHTRLWLKTSVCTGK